MADAVEDHAHRAGYNLILYNTHSDPERERTYLQIAAQGWVDGMLFVTTTDTLHGLGSLQNGGIPVVAIDRIPADYDGPSVILDNRARAPSSRSTCWTSAMSTSPTSAVRWTCASRASVSRASRGHRVRRAGAAPARRGRCQLEL